MMHCIPSRDQIDIWCQHPVAWRYQSKDWGRQREEKNPRGRKTDKKRDRLHGFTERENRYLLSYMIGRYGLVHHPYTHHVTLSATVMTTMKTRKNDDEDGHRCVEFNINELSSSFSVLCSFRSFHESVWKGWKCFSRSPIIVTKNVVGEMQTLKIAIHNSLGALTLLAGTNRIWRVVGGRGTRRLVLKDI